MAIRTGRCCERFYSHVTRTEVEKPEMGRIGHGQGRIGQIEGRIGHGLGRIRGESLPSALVSAFPPNQNSNRMDAHSNGPQTSPPPVSRNSREPHLPFSRCRGGLSRGRHVLAVAPDGFLPVRFRCDSRSCTHCSPVSARCSRPCGRSSVARPGGSGAAAFAAAGRSPGRSRAFVSPQGIPASTASPHWSRGRCSQRTMSSCSSRAGRSCSRWIRPAPRSPISARPIALRTACSRSGPRPPARSRPSCRPRPASRLIGLPTRSP